MRKISVLLVSLVIVLFSVLSCTPTVPQQEYDRVSNELSAIQSELASIQGKLVETEALQAYNEVLKKQHDAAGSEIEILQAKYEELSTDYEDSSKQFDAVNSELETMQAKYEELSTHDEELNEQFQKLSEQYDIIMEGTAEIDEADIEQAVFELVNEERVENGLNEREWGKNLYKWAIANSRNMATNKQLEYTEYIGWQDVFWATGYGTADRIANAALTIWKNHRYYERNFLNAGDHYCAVAVYKLGEIFYITYVADYYH
jgi:peptidoglycan hydrolase CwlO-like protein